jgi:adenine-specific DNA-methyltransferase
MKRLEPNSPEMQSADIVADNIAHLKTLFPEAFAAEGKIDFDVLKQLLGGEVDDREERYGLNWHGKRKARQLALTPSTGTLRPCPEESVDWDTTQNIFIEGDNLEVLKLLQKSYAGKVKLIYIDPPYNTGKDFVYPDNFQDSIKNYLEITGQVEGGQKVSSNTEASGRFHTDWLNMMLPRLKLARELLAMDGVLFVSIADHEVYNLGESCDEVFGAQNFVGTVIWHKMDGPKNTAIHFSEDHDYILVYARNAEEWRPNGLDRTEEMVARYKNPDNDPRGVWLLSDLAARNFYAQGRYAITTKAGRIIPGPPAGSYWRVSKEKFDQLDADNRIWWGDSGDNRPGIKRFLTEVRDGVVPQTYWSWKDVGSTRNAKQELSQLMEAGAGDDMFITPKPTKLLERIIQIATNPKAGDVIIDFFAGSGSMGHASYLANCKDRGNRRFVLVQLPEPTSSATWRTLSELTKQRLVRSIASIAPRVPASPSQQVGAAPVLFSDEHEGRVAPDLGFRVFKLDSGNLEPWDPATKDVPSAIAKAVDNVKADRTDDDLVFDVLLKTGLDLCVPIESKKIAGKEVKSIGGGVLFTCFATKIKAADAEPLALGIVKWRDELAPANPKECRVVFRDSAFESDVAKSNLAAILKQHGFDEKLIASL